MPQRIDNARALFEHELKSLYDAELKMADALKQQATESTDPAIKSGFERHQKETVEQAKRLEKIFDMLGKEPTRGEGCAGMEGLIEERKNFARHDPSSEVLDVFNLGAAQKAERYEVTAYTNVAKVAEKLRLEDALPLLMKTLEEEEAMLEAVTKLAESETRLQKVQTDA